ncbi:hypothetical protein ID866_5863 [Astraeus odoratus]|nr:hypothetical protein ID866_5863 [Astraeus odoratus]
MRNGEPHPDSWRKQFFLLRDAEAHRLEEVASKLRNQRMEAAERKKEREVKLTDRLPPAKRARGFDSMFGASGMLIPSAGSAASQPKTLFQKAKNEVKLRKSLYTSRVVPPMVQGKTYRVLPGPHSAKPPMASQSISQVTVSTIAVRHSSVSSTSSSVPSSKPRSSDIPAIPSSPTKLPQLSSSSNSTSLPSLSMYSSPAPTEPRLVKSPMQKKDPMASLFMPKHRALSQLPCQGKSVRSTPA